MRIQSSRSDQAAQLCPPDRTEMRFPPCTAVFTAATTSSSEVGKKIPAGFLLGRRLLKMRDTRASSYPASLGPMTCAVLMLLRRCKDDERRAKTMNGEGDRDEEYGAVYCLARY